jgi:hypothetical protein
METTLEPIHVMSVKAVGGTKGAQKAFNLLESRLQTLKGRKFYGTFNAFTDEYRANVQMVPGEVAASQGLEDWTIPGGRYLKRKVEDWTTKVAQLPHLVNEMAEGQKVDRTRPTIEFYRSDSELVLFLPLEG